MADTEEVNISHPTPEELQGINPYFILVNYQENFESSYKGMKTHEGKQVQEIVLAPKGNANEQITLWISKTNHPIYIKVETKKIFPIKFSKPRKSYTKQLPSPLSLAVNG